mmetsp:Transcript_33111/g.55471  ORF Transcript_33111/g.55471 Transcript_33111/m.55471 type:complete len:206 (-) Transcript_33111:118-735(-)
MVSLQTFPSQRAHSPNMAYTSNTHLSNTVILMPFGHRMSNTSRGMRSFGTHEGGMSMSCSWLRFSSSSSSSPGSTCMPGPFRIDCVFLASLVVELIGAPMGAACIGVDGTSPSMPSSPPPAGVFTIPVVVIPRGSTVSSLWERLSRGSAASRTYSHLSVFFKSQLMPCRIAPLLSLLMVPSCMLTQKLVWFQMNSTPSYGELLHG